MKSGLLKIKPDHRDYSLLHTFGAITPDPKGLPAQFSIYDGRTIPNQDLQDTRFSPPIRPLPYGCTGESQTFLGGLEDGQMYPPDDLYDNTPPGIDGQGRDIRASLQTTIDRGYKLATGELGAKRSAYFNCYGAGAIDDFDAVRIGLWINQASKRAVSIGTLWYPEFEQPINGSLPTPSFNTALASGHNYVATGWRTSNGIEELEVISWQGQDYGNAGIVYMSRAIYNALMQQPWTGAFTLAEPGTATVVPIGMTAYVDHLVYFIRSLFNL